MNHQKNKNRRTPSITEENETKPQEPTNSKEYDIENDDVQRSILWEKYQMHIDLYKFYMEQVVKLQIFYYGVTGGIFTYYFTHGSTPWAKYSLLLPLIMSVLFFIFFLYGVSSLSGTKKEIYRIARALRFIQANNIGVLSAFLMIFVVLSFIVAIVCVWVIIFAVPGSIYIMPK